MMHRITEKQFNTLMEAHPEWRVEHSHTCGAFGPAMSAYRAYNENGTLMAQAIYRAGGHVVYQVATLDKPRRAAA